MLEADGGHIPEVGGHCRHQAHADEGICFHRAAHALGIAAAGLSPKPVDVGCRRLTFGQPLHHHRHGQTGVAVGAGIAQRLLGDF